MNNTQRRRFQLIDLCHQETEWDTPIGKVTFFECHGEWFYKVDRALTEGLIYTSHTFESAEDCLLAINYELKEAVK